MFQKLREIHLVSLFLLFSSSLNAVDFLYNDFSSDKDHFSLILSADIKTKNLSLSPLEKDSKDIYEIDSTKKAINGYGKDYYAFAYNFSHFQFGIFKAREIRVDVTSGLNGAWSSAEEDFFLFLSQKYDVEEDSRSVDGDFSYYNSYGFFLQNYWKLTKNTSLNLRVKFHNATNMDTIKVRGTQEEYFVASLDHYYVKKNLLTTQKVDSPHAQGYGYSLDLEYTYHPDDFYLYIGFTNIESFIFWKNLSFMHYDFDSEVIYVGDDGYNHYKPFGQGEYKYDVSYTQRLPFYTTLSMDYRYNEQFAFGSLTQYHHKDLYFNELFTRYKNRYKLGYIIENQVMTFGFYLSNFSLELSNLLSKSKNSFVATIKINY